VRLHELIHARRMAEQAKKGSTPREGRPAQANLLHAPLPIRLRMRTPMKGPQRREGPPAFPVAAARAFRFRSSVPGQRPELQQNATSEARAGRWARFKT
jgi:hypothetical protein